MNINCCKSYVGKQIIGLLPGGGPPTECMWYWQSPDNAQLYTVNGYIISQINDINAELNPFGIYYNSYESYGGLYINFISIGLEAPTTAINILDENGNPVSYSWSSCCEKACYEITFNSGSEFIEYFDLGYGQPIWFDGVSFDQSILYDNFKYYYGSQITVTTDVTASSTYLKIENGYICGTPKVQTYNFAFTDMTVCAPPPKNFCYYSLTIISIPDSTFDNWTIDGNPFLTNLYDLTGNASNQANQYNYTYADERYIWIYTDAASLPAIPEYRDSFGNLFTPTWQQGSCELLCLEATIPKTDLIFINISTSIYSYQTGSGLYVPALLGYYLDVSNPAHIAELEIFYQSIFGPQVTITSTDVAGDYVVRINNTYSLGDYWTSLNSAYYFNTIPC